MLFASSGGSTRTSLIGAVSLDGRLIDIASIRMAEALIAKADSVSAAGA